MGTRIGGNRSDEAQITSQLVELIHLLPPTLDYRALYIADLQGM
jgi:hypothetical protein